MKLLRHHLGLSISSQHPEKSSNFFIRKMPVFQDATPWHSNSILPCIIPLWDSAPPHSPTSNELKLLFSGRCSFFIVRCTSIYWFHLSCVIRLWYSAPAHKSPGIRSSSVPLHTQFSGRCTLTYYFHFILHRFYLRLSTSSVIFRGRAHPFLSGSFSNYITLVFLVWYLLTAKNIVISPNFLVWKLWYFSQWLIPPISLWQCERSKWPIPLRIRWSSTWQKTEIFKQFLFNTIACM